MKGKTLLIKNALTLALMDDAGREIRGGDVFIEGPEIKKVGKGLKVKVSLTFRGRENAHRELGFVVINRVLKDCDGQGVVEMAPRMMGHSIVALLGARRHLPTGQPAAAEAPQKTEIKKLDVPPALG